MLQRTRQLLRQRTMLSNVLRGHLAELGIVSAKGVERPSPLKLSLRAIESTLIIHGGREREELLRFRKIDR
jgi:transposase